MITKCDNCKNYVQLKNGNKVCKKLLEGKKCKYHIALVDYENLYEPIVEDDVNNITWEDVETAVLDELKRKLREKGEDGRVCLEQ